jgi:hypothetical protein
MPYLSPRTVATSARQLFATAHSEALGFFVLKALGAVPSRWVNITSSNNPPPALLKIAGQPDGFDVLVKKNINKFVAKSDNGLPTRPGTRGTPDDYTLYFPITEEAQFLIRKRDANRNAVYSNITGGRQDANSDRATADDVYEIRDPASGSGKDVRFKDGYVLAAKWYYGPHAGTPMFVPLRPLAVWMHRTTELDDRTTIDQLVEKTIVELSLTSEELALLFDSDWGSPLCERDFVEALDLHAYFDALCMPSSGVTVTAPELNDRYRDVSKKDWDFRAKALGLRQDGTQPSPQDNARRLIAIGQRNLLFYGPPRTSKTYCATSIAAEYLGVDAAAVVKDPRFTRVQFHHGWSYGDFVRKLVPVPAGQAIALKRQNGAFLSHCISNSKTKSVFVIEEINRANLAEVLGEVFQVMELGYRGTTISLAGGLDDDTVRQLTIPKDLLLIATANDLDRSTLQLDFALLSRFATVRFPVQYDVAFQTLKARPAWNTETAERFVMAMRQVEEIAGYPVGHASLYEFGPPADVLLWYFSSLRPSIALYLTEYRKDELGKVDQLFVNEPWE